jgi:hypothetical protein
MEDTIWQIRAQMEDNTETYLTKVGLEYVGTIRLRMGSSGGLLGTQQ